MIVLPEDKTSRLVAWTSKLLQDLHTTQGELKSLVGTLISVTLAVWQSALHYRALQQTAHRSNSGCFRISEMSPASQVHDLGHRGRSSSSQCSGSAVGQGVLAVSPGASHSRSTLDSRGAADRSSSYLSGLEGNQLVASVV